MLGVFLRRSADITLGEQLVPLGLELLLVQVFQIHEFALPGPDLRTEQLVQLEMQRLDVPVLRVLDPEQRPGDGPGEDHEHGQAECPGT